MTSLREQTEPLQRLAAQKMTTEVRGLKLRDTELHGTHTACAVAGDPARLLAGRSEVSLQEEGEMLLACPRASSWESWPIQSGVNL